VLKTLQIKLEEIYVPAARNKEFDQKKSDVIIEEMMECEEEQRPIQVRQGDGRFVLVKGIHRLVAARELGETTIKAYLVHAKQHG